MTSRYAPPNALSLPDAHGQSHRRVQSNEWPWITPRSKGKYQQVYQADSSDYHSLLGTPFYQLEHEQDTHDNQQETGVNHCLVPRRFGNATIDSLKQTIAEPNTTPSLKRALQWLIRWCHADSIPSKGILLSSGHGTGKSFALAAVVKYLTIERKHSCLFLEFDHFLMMLKQCYHQQANENSLYDTIRKADVLVLDNIGMKYKSGWSSDVLQRIIGYRYNDMKPVLISTPLKLPHLMKQSIPEHTYSRLQEMCYWLSFEGPDRRIFHTT